MGVSQSVYTASKVESDGVCYNTGSAVILEKRVDNYHIGIIDNCLLLSGIIYLVVRCFRTSEYIPHIHAYAISDDRACEVKLLKVTDLKDYYPLDLYETEVSKLFVLRHHIL